jgi:hypothetical protein
MNQSITRLGGGPLKRSMFLFYMVLGLMACSAPEPKVHNFTNECEIEWQYEYRLYFDDLARLDHTCCQCVTLGSALFWDNKTGVGSGRTKFG